MTARQRVFSAAILGAGPGGTGPLVCAAQRGRLAKLLDEGIVLADRSGRIGAGELGQFLVNSDSFAGTFLECMDSPDGARFFSVASRAEASRFLLSRRNVHAPLATIGSLLQSLGQDIERRLTEHSRSCLLHSWEAHSIHLSRSAVISVRGASLSSDTITKELRAQAVVLALGGHQPWDMVEGIELVPDLWLQDFAPKILLTGRVLTPSGLSEVWRRIRASGSRRIVIVGGSHSAFSVAWALLHPPSEQVTDAISFQDGDISILHRSRIRVFYPSQQEATLEGYTDFTAQDICPLTGRIHRLGGLRGDGRALYQHVVRLGNQPAEGRVRVLPLASFQDRQSELRRQLDDAALVIPALGYRPRCIPIYGVHGERLRLAAELGGPLVDQRCRVMDHHGCPIPGVLGVGLASGFLPSGSMGGEPSFHGQANGVWLYQNDIGELILDQIGARQRTT